MKVLFNDIKRGYAELKNEFGAAFERVMQSGSLILGAEVAAFEQEWAEYCRVRGAVGVANGTDAITLALLAAGVQPHDEVITTPLSAGYTALAIVNAGAKPVFADIDEQTFNLDAEQIESVITPKTRAVIPVHLYGKSADIEKINDIAANRNLLVIEDAAQAHGLKFLHEKSLAATFSFYPTKNLGAFGDGGAVVSNDEGFLKRLCVLRQGGHPAALEGIVAGQNSRLDELQAAFLREKLKVLNKHSARREEIARIYLEQLKENENIILPASDGVFHLFVIRHKRRDDLKNYLAEKGVETLIHYPFLLHRQNLFFDSKQKKLPTAEKVFGEILSLPLYPQMTDDEAAAVCQAVLEFK